MRLLIALPCFCLSALALADAPAHSYTAGEYMAGAKAAQPQGGVYIRARLLQGSSVMQIQIKRRGHAGGSNDQLLQVLFPKERKGESLLLHVKGGGFQGESLKPGGAPQALGGGDRRLPVFGTDLVVEDLITDFFDWKKQTITGHETLGAVPCVVIESRPDQAGKGPSKVVTWLDEKRYVPMRVQVYDGGDKPARTVDTDKVMQVSSGYYLPIAFTITSTASGSKTSVEGSSSKAGLPFTDADFSEQAMQQVTPPPSAP